MARCKYCIHFCVCSPYTAPNESYPEVDGCKCFRATADVVPKSEVERLQAEAECLRNANADLALALLYECEPTKELLSKLEKTVREKVAREIFEDIDGKMLCFFPASSFVNAPNTAHYRLLDMLAELKKKYTEGEN